MTESGPPTSPPFDPILAVSDLAVEFPVGRNRVIQAVTALSFEVARGETLGVVGESGCGKTTTGRAIMQLTEPVDGSVTFGGHELTGLSGRALRFARRRMQMIFQDPVSSLNPRRPVSRLVAEGLDLWDKKPTAIETERLVGEALRLVGLDIDEIGERRPHELSGGQCQRVSIARALVLEPELLICDEAVSALDVSVQAQILNLLRRLRDEFDLTMLFISHDLAVVRHISDRVMVMYLGLVCELAPTARLYENPRHPYTRALLASIPGHDLNLPSAEELIRGEPPSPVDPPSGCRFRTRCPLADEQCSREVPELRVVADGHRVACHHLPTSG